MTKRDAKIPHYMTRPKEMVLFLLSILILSVLFIVIYAPANMPSTDTLVLNSYVLYLVIQLGASTLFLFSSHFIFYFIQKKNQVSTWGFVAWLVGEIIITILILTIIASALNTDEELIFVNILERVSFNIITILAVPYGLTLLLLSLIDRNRQITELHEAIEQHLETKPTVDEKLNFYTSGGRLSFSTRRANILYIEAAGNYCNIHYMNEEKEDTFILHNSMKHLAENEEYKGLMRCHKGFMVNIDNVKLLRKEKDGIVLELTQDARTIPVSRTYNEQIVKVFTGDIKA